MIRNVAWQAAATGIRTVVSAGALALIVRQVSADNLGRFGIAWGVCSLGIMLVQTSINQSLIGLPEIRAQHISAGYILSHFFATILALCIWVSSTILIYLYQDPQLIASLDYAALVVLFSAFGLVDLALVQRDLNFRAVAYAQVVGTIGAAVTGLVFAHIGNALAGLFIIQGFAPTIQFIFLRLYAPKPDLERPRIVDVLDLVKRGSSVALGALTAALLSSLPAMILGFVAPLQQVGIFVICRRLVELVNGQIGAVVNQVLYPTFARMREDHYLLSRNFLTAARYTFALSVVPLLFLCTSPQEILTIYAGARGDHGGPVLLLLCIMQLGYALGQNVNPTFLALERYDYAWKWNGVMALVQATLLFGIATSAISAAGSLAISALLVPASVWYLASILNFRMSEWIRKVAFPLFMAVSVISISKLINYYLSSSFNSTWRFVFVTFGGLTIYIVSMIVVDRAVNRKFVAALHALGRIFSDRL